MPLHKIFLVMIADINDFKNVFFIGIAGTGMSAIAQYLVAINKNVSGSDRFFKPDTYNEIQDKLVVAGISCFLQNGDGITKDTDLVVVSTAVEDTIFEVQKARQLGIPIITRSALLAIIAASKKTIAVGGTSGKSTTSAMLYDILKFAGLQPSIISGAGLVSIIKENKIGNAAYGQGEWLVIEADESDGSIVNYHPEVGLLLNIDKDHQEIEELLTIFGQFKNNTKQLFVVNQGNKLSKSLSANKNYDFSVVENDTAQYQATDFIQQGFNIQYKLGGTLFSINTVGKHNMENAVAATCVANQLGVDLETCAAALNNYEGIYRRHQVLGQKNGVWLIDDYAHNPAKCAAAIAACQAIAPKVIAWFQPHGYGPTKFLRNEFVQEISSILRTQDEIWMSEIFYAGGTAVKDISANDLISDLKLLGSNAFFIENRNDLLTAMRSHFSANCVVLLMGARDPSLEYFGKQIWENL